MTERAAPPLLLSVIEAMFRVAPGRFYQARRVLRMLALCIAPALLFWGVGSALEFGLGLSFFDLPAQRDQSAAASILLVGVVAAIFYGVFVMLSGAFDPPGIAASVKHPESTDAAPPAWWVTAVLTALAVGLAVVFSGTIYACDQWLFKSRNLFVGSEISFVLLLALILGVGAGSIVAVVNGATRLAKLAQPAFVTAPWINALQLSVLSVFLISLHMVLLTNLAVGAKSMLLQFGIKAQITPAMAIAAMLFSVLFTVLGAAAMWFERSREVRPKQDAHPRQDFWDIDLSPETSHAGTATTGYPFYLWRESADSRLGLSRPRFCVITDDGRELSFMFFDPSRDRQPTWAPLAGSAIAFVIILTMTFAVPASRGSLSMVGIVLLAALLGVVAGCAWHLGLILLRWNNGRFKSDGRYTMKPLRQLSGFSKEHAGEMGAMVDGQKAKTGHGLAATFDDGSMIVLTGNAWDFPSIVEHHSALTNAFRVPRDDYVARWEAAQKAKEALPAQPLVRVAGPSTDSPASVGGVPHRL